MDKVLPFFTDDFFKTIISSASAKRFADESVPPLKAGEIEIIDKDIQNGTKFGDNYVGMIFRALVKYSHASQKPQNIQLIIKTLDYDNPEWTVPAVMKVYEKESFFYTDILPRLTTISRGYKFGPECFCVQEQPIRMIVMEDLKEQGYQMLDRTVGLDYEHCCLALKRLAAFHVATMGLERKIMDSYAEGMCTMDLVTDAFYIYMTELVNSLESSWSDDELKQLIPKLKLIRDNHKKVFLMGLATEQDSFRVLNHGDIHINNLLFKYNGEKLADLKFVDYQLSFYTSPGYDLNYFLMINPDYQTRLTREGDLLEVYREEFNRQLKELKTAEPGFILTPELMQQVVREKALYGFNMMMTILPVMLRDNCDKDSTAVFTDAGEQKRVVQRTFQNEQFKTYLKYYLRKFNDFGTFDLDLP